MTRLSRPAVVAYLITLALALVVALFVGPALVRSMYEERSLSFLNALISGRDVHPVEKYLRDWQKLAFIATTAVALGLPALYWSGLRIVAFSKCFPGHGRSPRRLYAALFFICLYLGLSLWPLHIQQDLFPFCYYSMYSGVTREPKLDALQCYVVREDGTEELDWNAFPPFSAARLGPALKVHYKQGTLATATQALVQVRQSRDDRFRGLRVYLCAWELDDWATNVSDPSRTLLCEVMRDDTP
jgi:hypothetical protein